MNSRQNETLLSVARQCGVTADALIEWMSESLVVVDDDQWNDEALDTVRRIKRLTTLGINLPGVEVVLMMRQQLIQSQREIQRFEGEMREMRRLHENEIARLTRQLTEGFEG